MRTHLAGLLQLTILIASLASTLPAWADIPVPAERPKDWNDHPAPMPAPPPEKEEIAFLILAGVMSALASAALLRRRVRPSMRIAPRR